MTRSEQLPARASRAALDLYITAGRDHTAEEIAARMGAERRQVNRIRKLLAVGKIHGVVGRIEERPFGDKTRAVCVYGPTREALRSQLCALRTGDRT